MQNIRERKVCTFLCVLCLFSIISCVGPEEYDDGLLENLPAVINTKNAFTLNLNANKYTFDEVYQLELTYVDTVDRLALALTVTGFSGKDTAFLEIYDSDNNLTKDFEVTSNGIVNTLYEAGKIKPHRLKIRGSNFTGKITFMITRNNDTQGPVFGVEMNLPVIVDWNDNFTYLLDAQDFDFDHTYPITLNLSDTNTTIYSSLFVGAYVSGTATVALYDAGDSLLRQWDIDGHVIDFQDDFISAFKPKKIQVSGNNLTAVLEFILSK